jgi:hypothetical protein
MSVIPSHESLALELATLSFLLYGAAGLGDYLGPTLREYDRYRNKDYCQSRTMLAAFGLPRTADGWKILLNHYGFEQPTLSQVKQAANTRKEESGGRTHISVEDESYPELVASSVMEVTVGDRTYQYWSIR